MKILFVSCLSFACGVATGMLVLRVDRGAEHPPVRVMESVTIVHDTIVERGVPVVVERPVGPEVTVVGRLADTVSTCADSVAVTVATVQREFAGDGYRMWVSGIDPRLDSVMIDRREVSLMVKETTPAAASPRWGLSVGVGVTVGVTGRVTPGVNIGLSYRLFPR